MQLIWHKGQPIVNLDEIQSVDLDHLSMHSVITFSFSGKSTVVWSFRDHNKAIQAYQRIISNYSEAI